MDATRLRQLIDAALRAQEELDAARAAEAAAKESIRLCEEKLRKECGNLKAAHDGHIVYGDRVVRVGNDNAGLRLFVVPLVSVPVAAPPPPPLPEAPPEVPRKTPPGEVPRSTMAAVPPNTVPKPADIRGKK